MLRVRVLGDLEIEVDGAAVEPPPSRRARALLGWLALERRMQPRSSLAARFWPDVLDESARTSLRSALSALRKALGPDSERYLIAGRDEVGLAGDSLVWTDIAEFDRCVAEERLEDALALSRGELLAGLDEDWVYERRDEHRDGVAGVLARLAARAEDDHDLEGAISLTRRRAALDPLAEEPQRDLMRRLAAAGDRTGAIRVFDRFGQRLRDELRIVPSQATRELAEKLRAGEAAAPVAGAERVAAEEPAAVVTLLFTDLVGSTELLQQVGDDEAERLRRIHFGLLRDVSAAYSGHEVKNLGDGLMVAFPSAVNAIGCAIGIQQAVHRHNAREGNESMRVRVGLNIGEPIRDEGDYFGTPVVIAKRLCDKAEGGEILASELLRALVGTRGGFHFRSCGPIALKGIAEPLPSCQISWEPAPERRIPLPAPLRDDQPAPLVGRDAQIAELQRCWQQAAAGERSVAMVVGEPGIGKTRLAAEFCRSAHADGALVLLGRCYEESLVPYQSFVEALRHYVSEASPAELRPQIGRHRPTLAKLLPELPEPGRPDGEGAVDAGEREQFVLFDAVAALLRAVADERPLILMLDDLQWADASTLQMLRHVVRVTEGAPLLLLATYRQTEVDRTHPLSALLSELRRARALDQLTLGGLDEDDVAELISSQSGRDAPSTFARSIVERTQGNPFFVEELLRDASELSDPAAAFAVPQSVQDVLVRRLGRLDEACRRLVTVAGVAGLEFELDVLAHVTETPAEQVAETLEQAIAARIVEETPGTIGCYSFAHALIRETIYGQLSATRRTQVHRQIGETIERLDGEQREKQAGALAYHFSAAGDAAKAYEYHARAAAAAQAVYAIEPALSHYSSAIAAGSELGLTAARESTLRTLQLQRGRMRARTGDGGGAVADLEAVLDASRVSGDRMSEMETLNELGITQIGTDLGAASASHEAALEIARELGDTAAETDALDRLAVIASHLLQFDRALELGERALELARHTGDQMVVARALDSIKLAVWQRGDLERLDELTRELEALWRERGDLWYLQFTLQESAFVPIGRAQWVQAKARLDQAVVINRRLCDPNAEVLLLDALCWLHRSRGAYQEALDAGRQAVARSADLAWEAWTAATLGWTLLDLGAAADAAEVLERGVRTAERIGGANETVRCLAQLAHARLVLGAHDQARALADRSEKLLRAVTGGAFLFGAHAYAATARVLLATGAPERGESLLLPVLDAAGRFGWHEAAAISELVLGLCLEVQGERERAIEALTHAAAVADEHGLPAPAWEAHAMLARVGVDPSLHATAAEALAQRIEASVTDQKLRDAWLERARR
jgi:class 3 adenylate cyclase/tetratricopeptide (TPR) repeat protein